VRARKRASGADPLPKDSRPGRRGRGKRGCVSTGERNRRFLHCFPGIFASGRGALQIPPLRFASVGMTRGGRLLLARLATWMDGIRSGYAARTADPSTTLRFGRDDKGRALLLASLATWMDGIRSGYAARTADPSTALRFGRDDKGRAVTHLKVCESDREFFCAIRLAEL
jgi:hypothetical protein